MLFRSVSSLPFLLQSFLVHGVSAVGVVQVEGAVVVKPSSAPNWLVLLLPSTRGSYLLSALEPRQAPLRTLLKECGTDSRVTPAHYLLAERRGTHSIAQLLLRLVYRGHYCPGTQGERFLVHWMAEGELTPFSPLGSYPLTAASPPQLSEKECENRVIRMVFEGED